MIHPVDVHVGQKMKQIRKLRRMSQSEVAQKLGLSFQQIQKYEMGSNRVSSSRLYELSKVLDVPTSFFFDGLGDNESETGNRTSEQSLVNAVAAIDNELIKSRIVAFIEEVTDVRTSRSAA